MDRHVRRRAESIQGRGVQRVHDPAGPVQQQGLVARRGPRRKPLDRHDRRRAEPVQGRRPSAALTTKGGLSSDVAFSLLEDREGSLWVGTHGGGLNRLRDGKLLAYSTREGLSSDAVLTVYEDRAGDVWIGTDGGGLNRLRGGRFTTLTTRDGLSSDQIASIHQDRAGALWVGTLGSGLNRIRGRRDHGVHLEARALERIRGVAVRGSPGRPLGRHRRRRPEPIPRRTLHQLHNEGRTVAATESERSSRTAPADLWIGTAAGLNRFRDGTFTVFTTRDGLVRRSRSLPSTRTPRARSGSAPAGGLTRFRDGRFIAITTAAGLHDDRIFQTLEDGQGRLWMSGNRGIFSASREDLNAVATGAGWRGSPPPPTASPTGCEAPSATARPSRRPGRAATAGSGSRPSRAWWWWTPRACPPTPCRRRSCWSRSVLDGALLAGAWPGPGLPARQPEVRPALHGVELPRSGADALQVPARRLRQGLGGRGDRAHGALHQPRPGRLHVPRHGGQQRRRLERGRRRALVPPAAASSTRRARSSCCAAWAWSCSARACSASACAGSSAAPRSWSGSSRSRRASCASPTRSCARPRSSSRGSPRPRPRSWRTSRPGARPWPSRWGARSTRAGSISGAWTERASRRSRPAPRRPRAGTRCRHARSDEIGSQGGSTIVPVTGMTGELRGALTIEGSGAWGETERRLVNALAQHLGSALDLQHLREQLTATAARQVEVRERMHARGIHTLKLCPRCGRCYDDGLERCAADATLLDDSRLLPYQVAERYRLAFLLGEGGMGSVFEAHDERLQRDVALKVIRSEMLSDAEARFRLEREAQTLARIRHPGVIDLFDSGELEDGSAFLVMELLAGRDLAGVLSRHGPGTPAQVAALLRQAAARARRGSSRRRRPPRRQAGQHLPDARRAGVPGQAAGLRPGQVHAPGGEAHPDRATSWARPPTCLRSRWKVQRSTRAPTSTRWPPSRTRRSRASVSCRRRRWRACSSTCSTARRRRPRRSWPACPPRPMRRSRRRWPSGPPSDRRTSRPGPMALAALLEAVPGGAAGWPAGGARRVADAGLAAGTGAGGADALTPDGWRQPGRAGWPRLGFSPRSSSAASAASGRESR